MCALVRVGALLNITHLTVLGMPAVPVLLYASSHLPGAQDHSSSASQLPAGLFTSISLPFATSTSVSAAVLLDSA